MTGAADLSAIRHLGRLENYTIRAENEKVRVASEKESVSFRGRAEVYRVLLSGAMLLTGAVAQLVGATQWVIPAYLGAAVVGGYSNALKAARALPRLKFNMNVLMTIAVVCAMAIGEWGEGATVAFLFALSEMLEAWTFRRARRSIRSLMELAPKVATVKREGAEVTIPVDEVQVGDLMIVRPGEKISMDGVIVSGRSHVDEAAITGESIPVSKEPGALVYAGTLNSNGALEVRVTKRSSDTTLAKILQLVEEAQAKRASTQAMVDRFASYYTPAVLVIAAAIAVLPPLLLAMQWKEAIYRGLALLVVACPCALVVSAPVVIISAISNAARHGVLIKGGICLEQLAEVKAVAFDKTGTLTQGEPAVTDLVPAPGIPRDQLLHMACSVESRSEHPLARAIVQEGERRGLSPAPIEAFEAIPGLGASGRLDGRTVYVGSPRLFAELDIDTSPLEPSINRLQRKGETVVLVGDHQGVAGLIAIADQVREQAAESIAALKASGIERVVILTGDQQATAQTVAAQVGADECLSELLPSGKVEAIRSLLARNKSVAMVGDGINDAPALAASTVGIAMGGAGNDTALETADVVLMADDLLKLPFVIRLSRAAMRVMKQNVAFSVLVKLAALILVFPGWLTLWLAIFADMGATLLVTLNGIRLLRAPLPKAARSYVINGERVETKTSLTSLF